MRGGVSGRISRGTRVRGRGISTSNHSRNSHDEYEEEEGDEIMLEFMSTN